MKSISSSSNPLYKSLLNLCKNRNHDDLVLFEGEDLVREADEKGLLKYVIISSENNSYRDDSVPNILLTPELYRRLASFKSLPKMMGVASVRQVAEIKGDFIYLDEVQDPGNVGTIIRTALALNYQGIMLSPDSAFPFSAKVIQSSKGAIFKLPIMVKNIKEIANLSDYEIIGTSLQGETLKGATRSKKPVILIFGNEGHGIKKEVENLSDKTYQIPMHGIDSLNVGVAAGIFMYVFRGKE